uniref:Uncharacterized protein n=1 Tax=Siphoviridae sp. ctC6Q17 TaxID=2827271 RepID=A0A8S5R401_9CAUD|nr:MAG TPA: hypothetical protein [Siphoviridae sp. ctC6Q17]
MTICSYFSSKNSKGYRVTDKKHFSIIFLHLYLQESFNINVSLYIYYFYNTF